MRRSTFVGIMGLLAGCAGPSHETTGHTVRAPTTAMVEVSDLARDLAMNYREGRSGVIQLQRKPDTVIFVHESRSAHVNGRRIEMDRPCMRHGTSYILARPDADLVVRTLKRDRDERIVRVPEAARPVHRRETGLPYAWRPKTLSRPWRAIVIHHMASGVGSAAAIHRMHRQRGWDGLGYHFVIGNGTLTADGLVEIGFRWKEQRVGAHCRAPRAGDDNWWNKNAIGICLIGDFTNTEPTPRQMDQLVRLVRLLMDEYDIPASEVEPHGEIKDTACPGREFPWGEFQRRIR